MLLKRGSFVEITPGCSQIVPRNLLYLYDDGKLLYCSNLFHRRRELFRTQGISMVGASRYYRPLSWPYTVQAIGHTGAQDHPKLLKIRFVGIFLARIFFESSRH